MECIFIKNTSVRGMIGCALPESSRICAPAVYCRKFIVLYKSMNTIVPLLQLINDSCIRTVSRIHKRHALFIDSARHAWQRINDSIPTDKNHAKWSMKVLLDFPRFL